MTTHFLISPARCTSDGLTGELAAEVAGLDVFFRFHGLPSPLVPSGDPFVAAGIALAMERGGAVELGLGLPLSSMLASGLRLYQEAYAKWFPDLAPVPVLAAETVERSPGTGVGCFFSGGVDSLYSYVRNASRVTHLVVVRGLDIPFSEVARWERTRAVVESFAAAQGKAVLVVETNAQEALRPARLENFGAILISTALGVGLRELIVPASYEYHDAFASGSHVTTDPLLSNDTTRVFHDGAVPRVAKVAAIVAAGMDLADLRVCNCQTEYNCGRCEKCLRTLVSLSLLGAQSRALPGPLDLRLLREVEVWDFRKLRLWEENRDLAKARGRADIAAACDGILKRHARRARLRRWDERYLRGLVARVRTALRSTAS